MARTIEEVLREQLGSLLFQHAQLLAQLEQATDKLKALHEELTTLRQQPPARGPIVDPLDCVSGKASGELSN